MQTARALRQQLLRCIAIGSLLAGLLLGCATPPKEIPTAANQMEPPTQAEALATLSSTQAAADTPQDSLWQQGSDFGTLFVSQKALRVGDIVTVRIVESSSAVNEATTTTGRDSSIGINRQTTAAVR